MKSKRLHPLNKTGMDFNYKNDDIKGALADTHSDNFLRR